MRGLEKPATPMMERVARRWSADVDARARALYDPSAPGSRRMPETVFPSMSAARDWFKSVRERYAASGGDKPRDPSRIPVHEMANFLISYAHFTVFENAEGRALYMYDYDTGIYVNPHTGNKIDILIAAVRQSADSQYRAKVYDTLLARSDELMAYNPLPNHKIALGNGIYNLITGEFEPFSPIWTTFNKIDTPYHPEAVDIDPDVFGGLTFRSMCEDFANRNPERVRLLEEICKAVVVGECRRKDATFFIVGEGGDGKSTFFEDMLGSAIGYSNVAPIALPDIDDDNKVRLCESKKLILGTDNPDNYYMPSTRRFKQMSTHDRIVINVKYQDARSLMVGGMMVQLLNSFPRFTANDAMSRRIVPMKAENRYVATGTYDENVSAVVSKPRFSEHVLASILALPYRRDFSSCDMSLLDESLAINDTLGQFTEALAAIGALDEDTLSLPANHLYAAYLDWMEDNAPQDKPFKSRFFTMEMKRHLSAFGFRYNPDKATRPGSGTMAGRYKASCFHEMCEGEHLRAVIAKNVSTHFFERDEGVDPSTVVATRTVERVDRECSVYEYLKIEMDLYEYMSEEERRIYNREVEELARGRAEAAREERPAGQAGRPAGPARALPNVAAAFRAGDAEALSRVRSWLSSVASGADVGADEAESAFDRLEMHLSRAAGSLDDPALCEVVSNMGSAGTYRRRAQVAAQAVDALLAVLEGGGAR